MAEDGKKVKWCYIYKALLDRWIAERTVSA